MLFFKPTAVIALLVSAVIASPIELEARQAATNCGGTAFTLAAVRACTNAAYSYYQQGGTAGGSTYPHTFNNREGFSFSVAGPYQEFPLISSGAYSGG
ncbi:guanyl-specific ribonuclease f1 [Phlyctema vagabunda]|uniref:ribonuclease T1 n=1 Tax=Phlyctema vagabunda TaxID=108571 RepID=A0ABR4P3E6_9HELO